MVVKSTWGSRDVTSRDCSLVNVERLRTGVWVDVRAFREAQVCEVEESHGDRTRESGC
jgi:hypothetical protein